MNMINLASKSIRKPIIPYHLPLLSQPSKALSFFTLPRYEEYKFKESSLRGVQEMKKFLSSKSDQEAQILIKSNDYYVFRLAAANGNIRVLEYLYENGNAVEKLAMIRSNNYEAYRLASGESRNSIMQWARKVGEAEKMLEFLSTYFDY